MYKHFKCKFTISHVGHYPDLVDIAANVVVHGLDQSVLGEDIVYEFPELVPDTFKYLPFDPHAHSTPRKNLQGLTHALEGLDLEILQKIFCRAAQKHGLELVSKSERGKLEYHDRDQDQNLSHLDADGILQTSQIMVKQLVKKGMSKGTIPKIDNFNGDPQTTKVSFHVWEKQVMSLEGDYTVAAIRTAMRNSLNRRALQDISILSPNVSWQELLDTLRIKYQHKASYDSMLSVFYSLQMTTVEDCAAFSSKLKQKLSFVQAMYPDKLNDTQYWQILRERFFSWIAS